MRTDHTELQPALVQPLGADELPPTREVKVPPACIHEGQVIADRYLVLERLAVGGMGEVFRVRHVELGKVLALKLMLEAFARDDGFKSRFRLEALAASSIVHPNVVGVSDSGELPDGRAFFVMEYVEGLTLAELLREEGAQPAERVIDVGLQIARGLEAAHALGIVHRDLKPANVVVVSQPGTPERVKVLDFGIARVNVDGESLGRTSVGMVLGTAGYMAPEQVRAEAPADARTDVYALGLILHELLTGRAVFEADTDPQLMLKHVRESPAPLPVTVPEPLSSLVMEMLAKSPDDRPQTMPEVIERLSACVRPRPRRRIVAASGRGWAVLALVLLLLIGGATTFLLLGSRTPLEVVVVKVPPPAPTVDVPASQLSVDESPAPTAAEVEPAVTPAPVDASAPPRPRRVPKKPRATSDLKPLPF